MKTALDNSKASYDNLVKLIEPGGALYNLILTWSNNYQTGFVQLKNNAVNYLVNLQGLITSLNAANSYLRSVYGNVPRVALIDNYRARLQQNYNAIWNFLQNYEASEAMQVISQTTQLIHYKEVFAQLNVSQVTLAVLNTLNSSIILSLKPSPANAWLSLVTCSTDYANNTFIECFTDINRTSIYGPIYLSFSSTLPYNLYTLAYAPALKARCPLNVAQIHTFMVTLYNQYINLYNYYSTNVMPWEVRLLSAQNILQSISLTMVKDLLSPISSSINLLQKTTVSNVVNACLRYANTNYASNLENLNLRNPTQVAGFLNNVASTLSQAYSGLYTAINCIEYYMPILQRSVSIYLDAVKARFKQISGGLDIETWAQQRGIQCNYSPLTTPTAVLNTVIQTYYNLLNPSSPTSFVNNINITLPIGIIPPNSLSQGGFCG